MTDTTDLDTETFPNVSGALIEALRAHFPPTRHTLETTLAQVHRDVGVQDVIDFLESMFLFQRDGVSRVLRQSEHP